jgi:hypothetical protein
MHAERTYAGYLHGEIMRVVPVYVGLGVVLVMMAVLIGAGAVSGVCNGWIKGGSGGGCGGRSRQLSVAAAVSAPVLCGGGAVFLCGDAGGDVEHIHSVYEGVYGGE